MRGDQIVHWKIDTLIKQLRYRVYKIQDNNLFMKQNYNLHLDFCRFRCYKVSFLVKQKAYYCGYICLIYDGIE